MNGMAGIGYRNAQVNAGKAVFATNRATTNGNNWNDTFIRKKEEKYIVQDTQYASVWALYEKETHLPPSGIGKCSPVTTENYEIKVDEEDNVIRILDKDGNRLGAFRFNDIKIRRDSETGTEVLLSEYGTMYDAVPLNTELKDALEKSAGVEQLETEELQGYYIKFHQPTGLKVLTKVGEEGRGGRTLICSEADQVAFDKLVNVYAANYPNLLSDSISAAFYADLEVKGLAQHTPNGILTMGWDGMSYHDNADYKKNWSVRFGGNANEYQMIMDWFAKNKSDMLEMEKFQSWMDIFDVIGNYERIWSKEELEQGYLNN